VRTSLTTDEGARAGRGSFDGGEATSHNKQVAPTPRDARLRGTPAQGIVEPGSVPDCIEESSLVERRGGASVATLER
jgi:hypothetical protein